MPAMQNFQPRHFAIVPAAGSGSRMGAARPKQYLPLLGRPLIHHALAVLCAAPEIDQVFVVLSVDDAEWSRHDWSMLGPKLRPLFCGGATRADSVLGGLRAIAGEVAQSDWVLVHDAARPNLARSDLDLLLAELAGDPVGGLLAVPARDTLKRAGADGRVRETVDRSVIWQAYTPQMFHLGALQRALADALVAGVAITDEASALEWAGQAPRLIEGRADNLKVTRPEDLDWLRRRWADKH